MRMAEEHDGRKTLRLFYADSHLLRTELDGRSVTLEDLIHLDGSVPSIEELEQLYNIEYPTAV